MDASALDITLPTADEQTWVVDELAALIDTCGYEHFALAPLIGPDPRFFPDRWAGGSTSLHRVVRRLLVYADIDAEVAIRVHPDEDVGGGIAPAGIGSRIWFQRRDGETLHFAARASALREPGSLVPAAARAVSEAFRAWKGLARHDGWREQALIDLTTVFLGFGQLTTDACVRHGTTTTATLRLQATASRLGVLPPQVMAFALAVQLVARKVDRVERARIQNAFQANQAAFLRASLRRVDALEPTLATSLHLGARETWPPPPNLDDLTALFADDPETDDERPHTSMVADRGVIGMNVGRSVFRVERSQAHRLARLLGLPVVLLGMLIGTMQVGARATMDTWEFFAGGALLALVGLVVGHFIPEARCSEPQCQTHLTPDATTCPRCGGTVAGVIRHPKERLAAAEALERSQADSTSDASLSPAGVQKPT